MSEQHNDSDAMRDVVSRQRETKGMQHEEQKRLQSSVPYNSKLKKSQAEIYEQKNLPFQAVTMKIDRQEEEMSGASLPGGGG
ncbi:hypothetical protein EJB05_53341 [Eragrostis curvula]|uniref:Uncharacterized protein n=1 Tax=Eragrostis curvula TaxID=38414 RepID=A0A5J9SQG9_9POAL|nr:hypothetical protein EJB05_53341 [Eragrostis curvula]